MKMVGAIIILLTLIGSCRSVGIKTDECQEFYSFINENWIQKEPQIYGYKGDPHYWNATKHGEKYLKESCLNGLTKKNITKIFGIPSKISKNRGQNQETYYYCFLKNCLTSQILGMGIFFYFKDDNVDLVIVNPSLNRSIPK